MTDNILSYSIGLTLAFLGYKDTKTLYHSRIFNPMSATDA